MTPKEKAFYVIKKYVNILYPDSLNGMPVSKCTEETAKQCALIAVDEILNLFKTYPKESLPVKYWQEVKQEIQKL